MKTSNKLIIGLFIFILLAIVGSVLTLKAQYDKIDRSDPFLGYKRHKLKPFKFIRLHGYSFGYVQIQPAKTFEIMFKNQYFLRPDMSDAWKVNGDTLVIEHDRKGPIDFFTKVFFDSPQIYVTAPALSGIISKGFPGKISGWRGGTVTIDLDNSGMILADNSFDKLSINAHSGSHVEIGDENNFAITNIQVKDSSQFVANEKDEITAFGSDSTHFIQGNAKKKGSTTFFGIDSMHIKKRAVKPTITPVPAQKNRAVPNK